MLHALAIRPFKDNFWTTEDQPGNPRYKGKCEQTGNNAYKTKM